MRRTAMLSVNRSVLCDLTDALKRANRELSPAPGEQVQTRGRVSGVFREVVLRAHRDVDNREYDCGLAHMSVRNGSAHFVNPSVYLQKCPVKHEATRFAGS